MSMEDTLASFHCVMHNSHAHLSQPITGGAGFIESTLTYRHCSLLQRVDRSAHYYFGRRVDTFTRHSAAKLAYLDMAYRAQAAVLGE